MAIIDFDGVTPGPWGAHTKKDGQAEVHLPGNIMVKKVKSDESGGLFFTNGERIFEYDQKIGADVTIHGQEMKTEFNIRDFKSILDSSVEKAILSSWPKGSTLLRSLTFNGVLTLDGVALKLLRDDKGEPVVFSKNHYMYIPVEEQA